jgi:MoaA/NifB/PqqE/SkfB family radical SAM enzyme
LTTTITPVASIRSLELEITGTCQLQCAHCCTSSGPSTPQGTMTREDWKQVIADCAEAGIPAVQFIGGEPTLHPDLAALVTHALGHGLEVEVYSNLAHITEAMWKVLERPSVRLATSYYSDKPAEHERITGGRGSHARTRANLIEALRRGIPLRVGIVEVLDGQRVAQAEAELRALGMDSIRIDRARKVGRAAGDSTAAPSVAELCGHCFRHRAAIGPDGELYGCILSRFLPAGNVKDKRLAELLGSLKWAELTAAIPAPRAGQGCPPDDSDDCNPANTEACDPAY